VRGAKPSGWGGEALLDHDYRPDVRRLAARRSISNFFTKRSEAQDVCTCRAWGGSLRLLPVSEATRLGYCGGAIARSMSGSRTRSAEKYSVARS
jgi:hypothetical protein